MQNKLLKLALGLGAAVAAVTASADIKWVPTYQAALGQAKAANKVVMIEFYTTWDTNGQHLDSDTLSEKGVQSVVGKFVPVRINVEKEGKDLGKKFHITNYPTVLFVDKTESVVGIIDGFESADEFVKHGNTFLKDVADFPSTEAKYKANPKNLDAIVRLGVIYADRYQVDAALNRLAEAEKIDPANKTDKLSDLYNDIADYYQNASIYDPAIKYFKKTIDTSKVTDKRAYGYLSVASCYFTMDTPTDPAAVDAKLIAKVRAHFKEAERYVTDCLALPNLKPDDLKIAKDDMTQIHRVLGGTDDGGG